MRASDLADWIEFLSSWIEFARSMNKLAFCDCHHRLPARRSINWAQPYFVTNDAQLDGESLMGSINCFALITSLALLRCSRRIWSADINGRVGLSPAPTAPSSASSEFAPRSSASFPPISFVWECTATTCATGATTDLAVWTGTEQKYLPFSTWPIARCSECRLVRAEPKDMQVVRSAALCAGFR